MNVVIKFYYYLLIILSILGSGGPTYDEKISGNHVWIIEGKHTVPVREIAERMMVGSVHLTPLTTVESFTLKTSFNQFGTKHRGH